MKTSRNPFHHCVAAGLLFAAVAGSAQTLYVPSGTSGIGSSSSNVGVNASSPGSPLTVQSNALQLRLETASGPSDFFAVIGSRYDAAHPFSLMVGNNMGGSSVEFLGIYANSGGGYERIALLNGNVGIGTTSPTRVLDVNGPVVIRGGNSGAGTVSQSGLHFYDDGYSNFVSARNADASRRDLVLDASAFLIQVSGTEKIRVSGDGSVGIGTTSPSAKLDVAGNVIIDSANSRPISLGGNDGSIQIRGDTGGWAFGLHAIGSSGTNRGGFGFLGSADALSFFYVGDSYSNPTVVVQPGNGNVGIGTTSPAYKLAVNGTVRAKEVIVDTGWSDYVFAKGYRLAPLSEVEQHIAAEGRLPGIPSAREVAEHGVSVGEMQSKLLAKIEELTLHVIALEKELNRLKAQSAEREEKGFHENTP